ncbi:hypothetical protein KJ529_001536 [Campylobacter jejuni]|nr:hypothetical protein [Campylobacter jejuni]
MKLIQINATKVTRAKAMQVFRCIEKLQVILNTIIRTIELKIVLVLAI